MPRRKFPVSAWVAAAACAVPVVLYFVFFFSCAVNVPFGDDYAALGFVVNFTNPSWPARLPLLFSLHNEHRIVTLRLLLLLFHYLSLKIDLTAVAFLANLSLVGSAVLLAKSLDLNKASPDLSSAWRGRFLWLLPVFFLLFQPHHFQLTLWALCAFTNLIVYVLAFLSLYLLVRGRSSLAFAGAVLCAALAAFTNGNGIFVFFIGGLILWPGKKDRRFWSWAAAGLLVVGFYFLGYKQNPEHPSLLPYLRAHAGLTAQYFFSVVGAFADFGVWRPYVSVSVGGLMTAWLAVLVKKRMDRRNGFLFGAAVFVFLSLAALAATRAPFGLAQSFEPRYRFASVLLFVLLYLGSLETARDKKAVVYPFLAFSLVFSAAAFSLDWRSGRAYRDVLVVNLLQWNAGKAELPYSNPGHAESILRLAVKRGIYALPKRWRIDRPAYPFGAVEHGEETVAGDSLEGVFSGWALGGGGRLRIIVRRGPWVSDGQADVDRRALDYVGQTGLKEGSVPGIAGIYYGFPGTGRMLWEFRLGPTRLEPGRPPEKIYFYARDRVGRETLIGDAALSAGAGRSDQKDGAEK